VAELSARILDTLYIALEPASPGGIAVTPEERAAIDALPRPANAAPPDLEALIARFESIAAGTISEEPASRNHRKVKSRDDRGVTIVGWPSLNSFTPVRQLTEAWQTTVHRRRPAP
jgi:hypothetical protein